MARPATAAVRLLTGERKPVRLATTANIALYGLQTIDGAPARVGDRVLVKDQTDAARTASIRRAKAIGIAPPTLARAHLAEGHHGACPGGHGLRPARLCVRNT